MLLDKLEAIQMQDRPGRILAIFQKLEEAIDSKYEIGTYALASKNTPVLYTSDFTAQFGAYDGVSLNYDKYGEIDAVEYVAFP
jgi:hypothetical protein